MFYNYNLFYNLKFVNKGLFSIYILNNNNNFFFFKLSGFIHIHCRNIDYINVLTYEYSDSLEEVEEQPTNAN